MKKAPNDSEPGTIRKLWRLEKSRAGELPWHEAISRVACFAAFLIGTTTVSAAPATGPLRVHPTNPRYFTDGTRNADGLPKAVYLTGSHTWGNLSDGTTGPEFDYVAYLDFLDQYQHNFIRLWSGYSLGREPILYERSGPGAALDGLFQVDLARFDPRFFDRLRSRVIAARDRGIYVAIMLFAADGAKKEDWPILSFNPSNNVQEIDADSNKDGSGAEAYDLSIPRITTYQEAFVRKVIDTVNDLDNVLYEIGNEGDLTSVRWQYHFIRFIKKYEAGLPRRHPVGMTAVFNILNGSWTTDNRALFESSADWISPGLDPYKDNPPAADGRKVIICDVDHIWPSAPHQGWIWECFLRGLQPILMDWYRYGVPKWTSSAEQEAMRKHMGYALTFARRINLASLMPWNELASTAYCLADPGAEYLIYQPKSAEAFSVELKAGSYRYEWLDPAKNATTNAGGIQSSGGAQRFKASFEGDAVLHLRALVQTKVVQVNPRDGVPGVNVRTTVEIHFSNGLKLTTIAPDSIRLLDAAGLPVRARLGSDIEADVVNIQPSERLTTNTTYTVEVNSKLMDKEGVPVVPFRSSFTTGADFPAAIQGEGFQFTKTKVDEESGPTAIAVGPDGNVYVATYNGTFYRLEIDAQTGLPSRKEKLLTLQGKRKILGLAFDPEASATNLVAWITHDDRKAENLDVGTFSGVVSRLQIPVAGRGTNATETQYVTGLPSGWHPLNGCAFGPDKRLYISVGSMNRLGHDPVRPETPLSAAVVVADVRSVNFNSGRLPLNVQTSEPVNYDPFATAAPLRLYATGFREMYRLCWHSNGNLYGGVNQNDGTGRADTPSAPDVPSLRAVFPDEDLVRIVEGGYYGHPNPSRKQYVLLGGNPTAGIDPWEIPEYPVGVQPDAAFNPANLIFNLKSINGTSADGCAEYTSPGPLKGRLLVCLFEGTHTLHTFAFNSNGTSVTDNRPLLDENNESLRFTQPIDVTVHPTGRIYVADFGNWSSFGGGGMIWCLTPVRSKSTRLSSEQPK